MNDRNLPAYRWWKDTVLKRDQYTCQDCGQISGYLDVHHIKPFVGNANLRFDPNNGVTLCPFCHGKRHGISKVKEGKNILITLNGEILQGLSQLAAKKKKFRKNFIEQILIDYYEKHQERPEKSEPDLPYRQERS